MIYGIGTDICKVPRIAAALERSGERFARRILGPDEFAAYQQRCERSAVRGVRYAATRFAAKEAFSKAVGTGFRRGVFMKDIGVVNAPSGAPTLALAGGAKAALDAMIPARHRAHIHLTLTDDHPWAQAFVIIEAIPDE